MRAARAAERECARLRVEVARLQKKMNAIRAHAQALPPDSPSGGSARAVAVAESRESDAAVSAQRALAVKTSECEHLKRRVRDLSGKLRTALTVVSPRTSPRGVRAPPASPTAARRSSASPSTEISASSRGALVPSEWVSEPRWKAEAIGGALGTILLCVVF